ncbi:hypothetical protein HHK36_020322 [Tetracentron sinense]|uniref:NB-ARC domain-containing protein n=1 Tax=Tetracentron sinense TaxID=13715 RepID=A0A834YZE6_TETSI|nr:hypothetical protein HHK36_020322 [Tetracentron sinense]
MASVGFFIKNFSFRTTHHMATVHVHVLAMQVIAGLTKRPVINKGVKSIHYSGQIVKNNLAGISDMENRREKGFQKAIPNRHVRDIAYAIEDTIDEFTHRLPQHQRHRFLGFQNKHLKSRHHLAAQIQYINSKVVDVFERKQRYGLDFHEQGSRTDIIEVALHIEEAELVGIDKPREKLIGLLVKGESRREVQPIPQGIDTMNEDTLKRKINEFLEEKRYVVILDDIWRTHDWQVLKCALPDSNCGSQIMVTTRSYDIASSCREHYGHVYNQESLDPVDSLTLFCKKSNDYPSITVSIMYHKTSFSHLRSLFMFEVDTIPKSYVHAFFSSIRLLRVLDLTDAPLEKLPNEIVNLFHLRLKDNPLEVLQALPNLVYLKLQGAYDGEELCFNAGGFLTLKILFLSNFERLELAKVEEGAMPHLVELIFDEYTMLKKVPLGMECLGNLEILDFVDMPNEFMTALNPLIQLEGRGMRHFHGQAQHLLRFADPGNQLSLRFARKNRRRTEWRGLGKTALESISFIASSLNILPEPFDLVVREFCGGNGGGFGFLNSCGGEGFEGWSRRRRKLVFFGFLVVCAFCLLVISWKEFDMGWDWGFWVCLCWGFQLGAGREVLKIGFWDSVAVLL